MKKQARYFSTEIKQIDLDVNRTFRNHIMFMDRFGVKSVSPHKVPLHSRPYIVYTSVFFTADSSGARHMIHYVKRSPGSSTFRPQSPAKTAPAHIL